ncbi:MAG: nitroreductase family deazaflavin-dependent oxidoreductase [Deltaproteobacteria bacterium]|nr:nitroreductase family deazaflavin-dependent oxidoreductase [Deltaproteobacteria bacterium]NND27297.1 nitroreductase family deazaflavin-dependent oxidoreductase [Myxococcales bacterium]MBT8464061.1 nitroreductase family deazaflavin-dependent oxidoreductase [Deltaproteobacteria bacterium]MBT8481984.1 nitroreductase family deazaflavin-dependent oxidoreductase [Deltaproteobacteria bacterium]NNK07884.1 nitroreductase family deazaflavin-dependent oxidoreductase [Myxococcales bacterium]
MSYRDFINNLSVTPFGVWLVKTFSARVDPLIYRLTGGRYTSSGPLTIPQLTLTTIGRKSGKERTVQLGYTPNGDDVLVVASNFGGTNHPAWSYNLDANPSAKIRLGAEDRNVIATRLTDSEKAILWPKIALTIPQMKTYVTKTDRNIKVYRLSRG